MSRGGHLCARVSGFDSCFGTTGVEAQHDPKIIFMYVFASSSCHCIIAFYINELAMAHLHEFHPKKAPFGFRGNLHSSDYLDVAEFINAVLGKPTDAAIWWLELNTNMGSSDILIYIVDEAVYQKVCQYGGNEVTLNPRKPAKAKK